ncbi:MAG: leucine-rich repeat protein [Lachnospiraceae bacterium]
MRKKLSKALAIMFTAVLSVSMTATPIAQAAMTENSQIEIEASTEMQAAETTEAEPVEMEEATQELQTTEAEIAEAKPVETEEATQEILTAENELVETEETTEELDTSTEIQTTETTKAEETIEEATEELDAIQETSSEKKIAEGTCGEKLTCYLTDTGKLYINGTGAMYDYGWEETSPWLSEYKHAIEEIYLSDGITSIGKSAFENCTSLSEITIPNSVTRIGDKAFYDCYSLSEITIPDSVTSIGDKAFYECESLKQITIPDSITRIDDYTFYGCESLNEITIPNSVKSIKRYAFASCYGLNKIIIPNSVITIGEYAFAHCSNLREITILNKNCSIGAIIDIDDEYSYRPTIYGYSNSTAQSFAEEYYLTFKSLGTPSNPDIPSNPEKVAEGTCGENLTWYLTDTGKLYINGTGAMHDYNSPYWEDNNLVPWSDYQNYIKEVYLSDGITRIGECAFESFNRLSEITIPDSVTTIGGEAFANCTSLSKMTIPDSVTSIGEYAFGTCTNLREITIPEGVKSIESNLFANCSNLSKITIPNSVTRIGEYAFANCTSLSEVLLPESVTVIEVGAFSDCTSLSKINIPESITSISEGTFRRCKSLSNITIPKHVRYILYGAFGGCNSLSEITLPESVTVMEACAFDDCSNLNKITILNQNCTIESNPDSGQTISNTATIYGYDNSTAQSYAKEYNLAFKSLGIPSNSEEKIAEGTCGENLSWYLTNTRKLYVNGTGAMPNYNHNFEDSNFAPWWEYQRNIKEIYLNDGITTIGDYAFTSYCYVNKISIPNSVTTIGESAFEYCTSLSKITIPNSVTTIGESAFSGCNNLREITIPNSVTTIGESAFSGCNSLREITIPNSVTTIGEYAFSGCNSLSKITILNKNCKINGEIIDNTSTTIYGYSNSIVEAYAKKYKIPFKALDAQSNTYTITYDANGGKNAPAAQTKKKNIALTLSKTKPTKTGYTFLGWATSKTSTKVTYAAGASFKENKNITLYAVWKANTYKIIFDKNGGTGSMSTMSCSYNKSYTLKANAFKKTGYTFKGWNTKADGTSKYTYNNKTTIKNLSSINGKTIRFYAQWQPIKYTITYQLNGGENSKSNPTSYNIGTSTITLKNPTRKGYTFAGWYTSSTYKTKVTKISKGSTGNKALYAKWIANTYKIIFDKNGGTGSMSTMYCSYNKSYTLKANAFKRTGYTFKGWNTKADGTSKYTYNNKTTIKNLSSINGKTIRFYAQWQPIKYTITYQLNGGENSKSNPTSYNIGTSTITLKNPTRKGYTFAGWYTSSTYKTKITKIAKGSTGNKTLYAKWIVNKYTIHYDGNGATGGEMSDTTSCQYDKSYALKANAFERNGYTFTGWSTTKDGAVKYKDQVKVKNLSTVNGKVITLYAVWEQNESTNL